MKKTLVVPCTLAALLAGCATTPPPELEVSIPKTWSALDARSDDETAADRSGSPGAEWWTHFDDEMLNTLIEEALASNYDLLAAGRRIDAAVAQARIAGAPLKPTVSTGLDGSRRGQNFIGFPIPGGESEVLSTTTSSFGASLNVSWEIDLWGRLRAGAKAASAELEASRADYEAARLSLAGQTAKAWFALVEASEQVELGEMILDSRRTTRTRIQNRFELGLRDALDLRRAITNESQAEADLARRHRQLDATTRQLEVLLSRYPAGSLEAIEDLPQPPVALAGAGVPSEILERRPDLAAAYVRLAAAGFRIDEAKAALYPRLTLSGSAGRTGDDFSDLSSDAYSVWSLAAGLLQPIFQGGRLRANVERTRATQEAALEGYRQTILRAFAEVETQLAAEGLLQGETEAQEITAENAVASADLAERRYDSGLSDYLTVLTSQVTSQQAQSQLLAVRRQQLDARVDLILALGGDWSPESPEAGEREPDESGSNTTDDAISNYDTLSQEASR